MPTIRQYLESYLEQYFTFFGKQDASLVRSGIEAVEEYIRGNTPSYQKYVAMRELVGFLQALKSGRVKSTFSRKEREAVVTETRDKLRLSVSGRNGDLWRSHMQNLLKGLDQE